LNARQTRRAIVTGNEGRCVQHRALAGPELIEQLLSTEPVPRQAKIELIFRIFFGRVLDTPSAGFRQDEQISCALIARYAAAQNDSAIAIKVEVRAFDFKVKVCHLNLAPKQDTKMVLRVWGFIQAEYTP